MWRYYLSKVINFLKFIGIFAFVFLIGHNVYASSDTFDTYANGNLNGQDSWTNWSYYPSMKVNTNIFLSASSSVRGTGSGGIEGLSRHAIFNSADATTTTYFYIDNINSLGYTYSDVYFGAQFFNASSSAEICKWQVLRSSTTTAKVVIEDTTAETTVTDNLLPSEWYKVSMRQDSSFYCHVQVNDGTTTTALLSNTRYFNPQEYWLMSESPNLYFDNVNSDQNDTNTIDRIKVFYPVGFLPNGLQNFEWDYTFGIGVGNISYWTTYNNLKVGLVYSLYNPDTSTYSSSSIFWLYNTPMNTIVPGATYSVINNDASTFPTQQGVYLGLMGLYGDGTPLAYYSFAFGVGTTTTANNTAWCSNLCSDLTATSSPAWWQFWNWNTDTLGGTVMCSGRYLICYAFYPHNFSTVVFNTSYDNFKQAIPFNLFFDIASTTQAVFSSSTLETNNTFGLPMIDNTGKHLYIMKMLNSSSTATLIGNSNATIFRNSLTYLIYSAFAIGAILIIW